MGAVTVGRDDVLARLRSLTAGTAAGTGRFALLTGPAGIGKTTMLAAAAELAAAVGVRPVWGFFHPGEGAPAFSAWRQVARDLGVGWPEPAGEAADARFALFEAVVAGLLAESRVQPVLVLLDDLQWADEGSSRLLDFLARRLPSGALAVLAASRADGVAGAEAIPLAELTADEVAALVGDPEVYRRAGGNPFLVTQVAAGASGSAVREALADRFAGLPAGLVGFLGRAAVWGRSFVVSDVEGRADVAPAVAAGVLRPEPGRFAFSHDLFMEYAYGELPADARRDAHAHAASTLAGRPGAVAAEVAAHLLAARAGSTPDGPLYDACVAAGREAAAGLAFERAAGWWAHALDAADGGNRRVDALIGLGDAQRAAGDGRAARATYARAAAAASGYPAGLALAALGRLALGTRVYRLPDELPDALAEAADACAGSTDARTRRLGLQATAGLARTLAWHEREPARAAALADAAVAGARADGDPVTLARCLLAVHHARRGPGNAAARAGLAAEIERVAYAAEPAVATEAVLLRAGDLMEAGDPGFRDVLDEFDERAARSGQPHWRYASTVRRAMRAAMDGAFAEAERLAADAAALGAACGEDGADDVWREQFWSVAVDTGRYAELVDSGGDDSMPARGLRAIALLGLGATGRAAEVAAPLLALPLVPPHPTRSTLPDAPHITELLIAFGRPDQQRIFYQTLRPYAGECAVSGVAVSFRGAVAHHAGRLAAAAGDLDAAASDLDAAVAAHHRLGAVPWALRSRYERAILAARRGEPATPELRDVADHAARLGMAKLAHDATAATAAADAGPPAGRSTERGARPPADRSAAPGIRPSGGPSGGPAGGATADRPAAPTFVREGATWAIAYDGVTVRLRHSKGLADLAVLVASPGTEISAIDLAAAPDPSGTARAVLTMGADAILDPTARRRLRDRVAVLDADVTRAEQRGDEDAARRARAERAELFDALGAATGLAGRPRLLDRAAERARKSVTARIRDAIDRIAVAHPRLGASLASTVTTGIRCAYRPGASAAWPPPGPR